MKQIIMATLALGLVATAKGPQVRIYPANQLEEMTAEISQKEESQGGYEVDISEVCNAEFEGQLNQNGDCVYLDWNTNGTGI